jgi:hypothetical protein
MRAYVHTMPCQCDDVMCETAMNCIGEHNN